MMTQKCPRISCNPFPRTNLPKDGFIGSGVVICNQRSLFFSFESGRMSGPSRRAVDCGHVEAVTAVELRAYSIIDRCEELMHALTAFDI
jgi:hypothetical protein